MKLGISKITVGDRYRKEMGDVKKLADSIRDIGLLQAVGVTSDHTLIFGERRLRACRDVLGWTEIDVRVIDMPRIVVGENAENEVRKDFTPSERVAIARAISAEIGDRQGRRMDKQLPQEFAEVGSAQSNPENIAEAKRGQETRDFAAKRAGFGNRETFRQAEKVVDTAEPELVQAMDDGKVSIFNAHKALKKSPDAQREVARTGKTIQDSERERAEENRRRIANQHPLVKVQTVVDAVMDIAHTDLTPAEFERLADGPALLRFRQSAIPALVFIRALTEVGSNDQARTG